VRWWSFGSAIADSLERGVIVFEIRIMCSVITGATANRSADVRISP